MRTKSVAFQLGKKLAFAPVSPYQNMWMGTTGFISPMDNVGQCASIIYHSLHATLNLNTKMQICILV